MNADHDDTMPDFGPCCICEGDDRVETIIMLTKRAPVPGHGWGCVLCRLSSDGAYAIICAACFPAFWQKSRSGLTNGAAGLRFACHGYLASHGRIPIAELTEPFDHDPSVDHG